MKNNEFIPIEGKSSLIKALSDQASAIRQFIDKNKFDFKRNIETAIINTAAFYETLKK